MYILCDIYVKFIIFVFFLLKSPKANSPANSYQEMEKMYEACFASCLFKRIARSMSTRKSAITANLS